MENASVRTLFSQYRLTPDRCDPDKFGQPGSRSALRKARSVPKWLDQPLTQQPVERDGFDLVSSQSLTGT
ncbi:hypothetical protein [Deinococcus sp.]|uniref:hypothetical protein n=1 Tax=Deinococcus sp. TaxID=47478 RepID=UPI0025C49E9D|nr:hypothetical protein [Deinococcus sp.]